MVMACALSTSMETILMYIMLQCQADTTTGDCATPSDQAPLLTQLNPSTPPFQAAAARILRCRLLQSRPLAVDREGAPGTAARQPTMCP